MKNPENKPLRIYYNFDDKPTYHGDATDNFCIVLSNLAIAQSNLVKAGKDSALPHLIACVKELERIYGFTFQIADDSHL